MDTIVIFLTLFCLFSLSLFPWTCLLCNVLFCVFAGCHAVWSQRKVVLLWSQLWAPTPPIWESWTWATIIQETQQQSCLLHWRIHTGDWTFSGMRRINTVVVVRWQRKGDELFFWTDVLFRHWEIGQWFILMGWWASWRVDICQCCHAAGLWAHIINSLGYFDGCHLPSACYLLVQKN